MLYLVTVTFSWFFKVHFGFLSLKCKSWNISVVFCRGLPCHNYILLIFQSSFWISFVEIQEMEYFSSVFVMVYLVTVTFSWFFKVHFEFLSSKCKSWNISVVFCYGLPCQSYIFLIFQSSFRISFIEMQELEYFSSVLSWFTLSQLHSLDFSKFKWISFIEMQELEYFSSVLSWFTLSQLHSLDFSKFILDFFHWNACVGIFQ